MAQLPPHHATLRNRPPQRALVDHDQKLEFAAVRNGLPSPSGGDQVGQLGLAQGLVDAADDCCGVLVGSQQAGDEQGLEVLDSRGPRLEVDQGLPELGEAESLALPPAAFLGLPYLVQNPCPLLLGHLVVAEHRGDVLHAETAVTGLHAADLCSRTCRAPSRPPRRRDRDPPAACAATPTPGGSEHGGWGCRSCSERRPAGRPRHPPHRLGAARPGALLQPGGHAHRLVLNRRTVDGHCGQRL